MGKYSHFPYLLPIFYIIIIYTVVVFVAIYTQKFPGPPTEVIEHLNLKVPYNILSRYNAIKMQMVLTY